MRNNKWLLLTLPACLLGIVLLLTTYKVVGAFVICCAIVLQLVIVLMNPSQPKK